MMGKESNVVFQQPADGAAHIAGNFDLGLSLVEGPAFFIFWGLSGKRQVPFCLGSSDSTEKTFSGEKKDSDIFSVIALFSGQLVQERKEQ